ncbi:flagellar assembly protein FliH [Methylobacillus arboreus]|uniref:flagellar assembly protein FliH n=1 Tax=Methylobacillus arboreus TaxID=755170 RepID=UPI001E59A1AC|nr:flagellar assembly protein FliH [Methylobacillus arboreus]MCB5189264.1 flagellar assembly protein FliH [Methylobacillus arboreus]
MSNVVIPKEKQTAYQRWEMASFSEEPHEEVPAAQQPVPQAVQESEDEKNARLEAELEQARREGYKIGLQQGFDAGIADAAAQAKQDSERLQALLTSMDEALKTANDAISEQLLALALDIAKAMVKDRLHADPAIILPIVQESIHYLPTVQRPAKLIVNPQDAPMVKKYLQEDMADSNWQIHEDASLERGGCMVETGDNQIDGSNATRWKRICDALAQHSNWVDPNE